MVALRILTESEIHAKGLKCVKISTRDPIKLLCFSSFFGVEHPVIYFLFQDLHKKYYLSVCVHGSELVEIV